MVQYNKPLTIDGKPLKLLEAGKHWCIRCQKKSKAFQALGYEVHALASVIAYGVEGMTTYSIWKSERQFKDSIKNYIENGINIITWNNEPDSPAVWIREVIDSMNAQDKVKLVVDCHDLDSIRRLEQIIPIDERKMFNMADGIIYVSLPIQQITNKLHTISKPNICIYSYCNENVVDYSEDDIIKRTNALVYEGGVNALGNNEINLIYPYRNLFPVFKELIANGNEVHAIVGNTDAFITGQTTGTVLYEPMVYDKMLKKLTEFKWGILIFNNEKDTEPQVRYTLTNKAQEYLMAGLPSITCWCAESEKWIEKHKIGIIFKHIKEIGNCAQFSGKYVEIMENIKVKRKELIMENYIWRLENLYAELLGLQKKQIPSKIRKLSEFEYGKKDTALLLK
uniref:Putative methyltransferase n=1 Tax=viral metagenome TaxID=1070528 RepID=A0A6M3IFV3_9ZZZZ